MKLNNPPDKWGGSDHQRGVIKRQLGSVFRLLTKNLSSENEGNVRPWRGGMSSSLGGVTVQATRGLLFLHEDIPMREHLNFLV